MPIEDTGKFRIIFPEYFIDSEIEDKGYFNGEILEWSEKLYNIMFFDPCRISQEILDDIASRGFFFEKNVIILDKVNSINIETCLRSMFEAGEFEKLL